MSDEINTASEGETEAAAPESVQPSMPDQALAILEEMCEASGMQMEAVIRSVERPYVHIELIGPEAAATWGRLGHSLDALQFLVNLIVAHRVGPEVRVVLDADNYRKRRADALTTMATELAAEVKARNEEAEFEPLPAHERRIIHAALADDPGIETYSEGDDPDRRVVIAPRH